MGLWDNILDWFSKEEKYSYNKDEVERATNDLNNQLLERERNEERKRYDEYLKELETMLPEIPDLEYKEIPNISDEELEKKANEDVGSEKEKAIKKKEEYYNSKVENVNDAIEKNKEKLTESTEKLKQEGANEAENFKNKAIKNGLIGSSITSSYNKEIVDTIRKEAEELNKKYSTENEKLNSKIDELENLKSEAVNDLDGKYAEKLQSEIEALKKERDKNTENIKKYNADVEKQINNAKLEQEKIKSQLAKTYSDNYELLKKEELKHGYQGDRKKEYDERLNIVKKFYSQFPSSLAKDLALSNKALVELLGANYNEFKKYLNTL